MFSTCRNWVYVLLTMCVFVCVCVCVCMYIWMNVCIYKAVLLESKLLHNRIWSATAWSPYRPAVISLQLPVTALSFLQRKILCTFTTCRCFRFLIFFSWVNLKLPNVKLLKLGSFCIFRYLDIVNRLLFQTEYKVMKWISFHHLGHIEIYSQSITEWPM